MLPAGSKLLTFNFKIGFLALFLSILAVVPFGVSIARADWKDDLGTLRIGIVANGDIARVFAKVEPFRLAVSEKLGIPVEIIPSGDLASLIQNHAEKRVEYAIFSAASYAATWQLCECVEPLVVARSSDGSHGIYPVVIARKDGPVKSINDLAGKNILIMSKQSVVTYSLPIYQLKKSGIDLTAGQTRLTEFPSADEALEAFAAGEGDAILGWSSKVGDPTQGYSRGTMKVLLELDPVLAGSLGEVWSGPMVPHRVHSIQKNIASEPKSLLRELLTGLYDGDPVAFDSVEPTYYGGGFDLARQSDFDALVDYFQSTGKSEQISGEDAKIGDQDLDAPEKSQ